MGLDWMLHPHVPKKGCETEYLRLKKKLSALSQDKKLTGPQRELFKQELEAELEKVAVSPFEVIGASRVGVDVTATEWFRKHVFEDAKLRAAEEKALPKSRRNQRFLDAWDKPFDDVLRANRGKYVAELAARQEGVSPIRGICCSPVDFRGAVVGTAECLPEELQNRAYEDHQPETSSPKGTAETFLAREHLRPSLASRPRKLICLRRCAPCSLSESAPSWAPTKAAAVPGSCPTRGRSCTGQPVSTRWRG